MSQITTCIKASIILFTASSVFSTAYAATASGTVTVGISNPVSISKVSDLNIGVVTKAKADPYGDPFNPPKSSCSYTYVPAAGGGHVSEITGSHTDTGCQWVDMSSRSMAVFDVSCESGDSITHTVDFIAGSDASLSVTNIVARVTNKPNFDVVDNEIGDGEVEATSRTTSNHTCYSNEQIRVGATITVDDSAAKGLNQTVGTLLVTSNH